METARAIGHLGRDEIHYVIAGLKAGVLPNDVLPQLTSLDYVEAYSKPEFGLMAQRYGWKAQARARHWPLPR